MEDAHLVSWINTVDSSRVCNSLEDLFDGEVLYELVAQIDPRIELSLIKRNTGENWVLRNNNIKRIISCLNNFFQETKNITVKLEQVIDAKEIAVNKNINHIRKLLEYIIVASVEIPVFIEKIITLEESVQRHLFAIISSFSADDVHKKESVISPSKNQQISEDNSKYQMGKMEFKKIEKLKDKLQSKEEELEFLQKNLNELKLRNDVKEEENLQLQQQIYELNDKIEDFQTLKEEKANFMISMHELEEQNKYLQSQISQLKLENNVKQLENKTTSVNFNEISNLHEEIEEQKNEISLLKRKNLEITQNYEYKIKELKEEVDVLREKEMELNSMTTKMNNLKLKLGDIQKYKESSNQAEEKYNSLYQSNSNLQAEYKIILQNNKSLSSYKDKCSELTLEKMELQSKMENQSNEIEKLKNEVENLNIKLQNEISHSNQIQRQLSDVSSSLEESKLTQNTENDSFDASPFSDSNQDEEIEKLKKEINELKTQHETQIEKTIQIYEQKLDQSHLDHQSKIFELTKKLENQTMGRGEEIEKLTKENEELKEEINLSHQKNFNIEKQIEKLNFDHLSEIEELKKRNENENESKNEIEKLQNEISQLNSEKNLLVEKISNFETQIEKLNLDHLSEIEELKNRNENENKTENENESKNEIEKLQNEISELNSEKNLLLEKISNFETQIEKLNLDHLSEKKDEEKGDDEKLTNEISELKLQNETNLEKILHYEKEIEELKLHHQTKLEEMISKMEEQNEEFDLEVIKLNSEISQLKSSLALSSENKIEEREINIEQNKHHVITDQNEFQSKIEDLEKEVKIITYSFNLLNSKLSSCNNATLKKIISSPSPLSLLRSQNNI